MKTIEIITGIVAGGIFITWVLYLAARLYSNSKGTIITCDGMCNHCGGRLRQICDNQKNPPRYKFEDKYISSKKGCPRRDERP